MVKRGFIAGALLLALVLGMLWRTSASAQSEMYNGAPVMAMIATELANSTTSLQFTGLPSTYNTLLLDCNGIIAASSGAVFYLVFGEGATPTWKSTNYKVSVLGYNVSAGLGGTGGTSDPGIPMNALGLTTTANYTMDVKAWIHNIGNSSVYKEVVGNSVFNDSAGNEDTDMFSGIYTGDTGVVTAIEVGMGTGNISSGQCSLYGLSD